MNNNTEQLIQNFREELNKLKPAVQLVKDITLFSEEIQRKTLVIWEKAVTTVDDLKSLSQDEINTASELLSNLHKQSTESLSEINALSTKSINDLQVLASGELIKTSGTAQITIDELDKRVQQNLEEVRSNIIDFVSNLNDILEELVQQIESLLEAKVDQLRDRIDQLVQNLPGLLDRLANLIDFLEKADIAGRLRRIEDALATLNTSVQNLHGRIDFMELNLREEHKKTQVVTDAIHAQIKGFKWLVIILLGMNILLTAGMLMMLIMKW